MKFREIVREKSAILDGTWNWAMNASWSDTQWNESISRLNFETTTEENKGIRRIFGPWRLSSDIK